MLQTTYFVSKHQPCLLNENNTFQFRQKWNKNTHAILNISSRTRAPVYPLKPSPTFQPCSFPFAARCPTPDAVISSSPQVMEGMGLDGLHSLRANHDSRPRRCPYDRLGLKFQKPCYSVTTNTWSHTRTSLFMRSECRKQNYAKA